MTRPIAPSELKRLTRDADAGALVSWTTPDAYLRGPRIDEIEYLRARMNAEADDAGDIVFGVCLIALFTLVLGLVAEFVL